MRTQEIREAEAINRMPVGGAVCPIEAEIADEIGDTDVWEQLEALLYAHAGAV